MYSFMHLFFLSLFYNIYLFFYYNTHMHTAELADVDVVNHNGSADRRDDSRVAGS